MEATWAFPLGATPIAAFLRFDGVGGAAAVDLGLAFRTYASQTPSLPFWPLTDRQPCLVLVLFWIFANSFFFSIPSRFFLLFLFSTRTLLNSERSSYSRRPSILSFVYRLLGNSLRLPFYPTPVLPDVGPWGFQRNYPCTILSHICVESPQHPSQQSTCSLKSTCLSSILSKRTREPVSPTLVACCIIHHYAKRNLHLINNRNEYAPDLYPTWTHKSAKCRSSSATRCQPRILANISGDSLHKAFTSQCLKQ